MLPNLRTAMLSATVLTVALVLGEFTMASLDLYQTFPVWIVTFDQTSGPISVAASLLALFVTWIFLLAITMIGGRGSRRKGGAEVSLFSASRQNTHTGGILMTTNAGQATGTRDGTRRRPPVPPSSCGTCPGRSARRGPWTA